MNIYNKIINTWDNPGFKKYFTNTSWMFAGQMMAMFSLLVNILIARYLGPTNFGSLSYIFAFVSIFFFISHLGLNDIIIRDLVKYPEKIKKILSTSFFLLFCAGLVAFIVTNITSFFINGFNLISILIVLYSTIFLWSPSSVIVLFFQSKLESKQNAIIQVISTSISFLLKMYFVFSDRGIIWLTAAFAIEYAIISVLCFWRYRKIRQDLININSFDKDFAKTLLRSSYPLLLSSAFLYLILKIDQVFIKNALNEMSLGLYAAAKRISELWYFVPLIISASLFPAIINAKEIDHNIYKNRLKKIILFMTFISISIAICITISSYWLIPLIFGKEYIEAIPLTQIVSWSSVGYALTVISIKYLTSENRLKEIAIYMGIAAIIDILLILILFKYNNMIGVAYASAISCLIMPLLVFLFRKTKL